MSFVPNTTNFSLHDVCDVILPSSNDLQTCIDESIDGMFDPLYKGDKTTLYNFRNYGCYTDYLTPYWDACGEINYSNNISWSSVRGNTYGTLNNSDPFAVGNSRSGSTYTIRRMFLCFDLTAYSGMDCFAVELGLWTRSYSGDKQRLYIQEGSQNDFISLDDYNNVSFVNTLLSIKPQFNEAEGIFHIEASSLEATNIGANYFGHLLKLGILSTKDMTNNPPTDGTDNNYDFFISGETIGDMFAPYLGVSYR